MITQGLVTLTREGHAVLKAVCGCNGNSAEALARHIRERNLTSVEEIYQAALMVEFGCPVCLVVFTKNGVMSAGGEIPPWYWKNFDEPDFNPRWDIGKYESHVQLEQV
jgi:NAD(P)H-nitrite reductase large subunit